MLAPPSDAVAVKTVVAATGLIVQTRNERQPFGGAKPQCSDTSKVRVSADIAEVVFDPTIARQNLRPSGTDRALNLRERLLASCLVAGLICRARSGHSLPDNLCLLW